VKAIHIAADVSRPVEIAAMIERTIAEFGKLDILVNNAGIQHVAPVVSFPAEKWEAIVAINLSSVFYAARAALPGMLKRNWGRIINIASVHGVVASAEKSAYVAAKHGVVGFTKSLALETAKTGVTCNAICPGWVHTALAQQQIDTRVQNEKIAADQAKLALLGEKTPSLEFVTPEQIGALAVFLCSEAASQIRGAAITMDGGWTAQ
jgi:3-hydroxybutyrate dehydrogenase